VVPIFTCSVKGIFESITPATGHVILGDGKTSIKILGVGTVKCCIGDNILSINNVCYVPELSESIYSLFQHIHIHVMVSNCLLKMVYLLCFPHFRHVLSLVKVIFIWMPFLLTPRYLPIPDSMCPDSSNTYSFCHHLTGFQQAVTTETEYLDNLLSKLREFYAAVKTKCQLNLDVPSGFRKLNQHQLDYNLHLPLKHQDTIDQPSSVFASSTTDAHDLSSDTNEQILLEDDTNTNTSSSIISPPIT
jgi:hypothetical protein